MIGEILLLSPSNNWTVHVPTVFSPRNWLEKNSQRPAPNPPEDLPLSSPLLSIKMLVVPSGEIRVILNLRDHAT